MATQTEHSDSEAMDIADHMRTWKGFTTFVKWSIAGIGALMILLAIFRTHG